MTNETPRHHVKTVRRAIAIIDCYLDDDVLKPGDKTAVSEQMMYVLFRVRNLTEAVSDHRSNHSEHARRFKPNRYSREIICNLVTELSGGHLKMWHESGKFYIHRI